MKQTILNIISNNIISRPVLRTCLYLFFIQTIIGCTNRYNSKSETDKVISPTLVIHGGAGTIKKENLTPEIEQQLISQLEESLKIGYKILDTGGTSINAVRASIRVLEDSPLFNAGKGAVFNYAGKNELDASIMDGATGMAGAVAGASCIKNPIEAAYAVMKKSRHVLLTGKGADEFAKLNGLQLVDPSYFYTEERYLQMLHSKENDKNKTERIKGQTSGRMIQEDFIFGTVGAVALDKYGNLAAGTSTGGMTNKRFGRIGDSPIIGAGTFADNQTCAVSSTGHGEYFIKNVVAYDISARMKYQDKELKTAANEIIQELKVKEGFGGVICVDKKGNISMPFNTEGMYRGYINEKDKPVVNLFREN